MKTIINPELNKKIIAEQSLVDPNQILKCLSPNMWALWQNTQFVYQGCSQSFANLVGVQAPADLIGLRLANMQHRCSQVTYDSARDFEIYSAQALDCKENLNMNKKLFFEEADMYYSVDCKIFPLLDKREKISGIFVLGLGQFSYSIYKQNIFKLINRIDILKFLTARNFLVKREPIEIYLSRREMQCLLYLVKGKTAKEAAQEMYISPRTVEDYIGLIKEKLGCKTRSELVCYALEHIIFELFKTQNTT